MVVVSLYVVVASACPVILIETVKTQGRSGIKTVVIGYRCSIECDRAYDATLVSPSPSVLATCHFKV